MCSRHIANLSDHGCNSKKKDKHGRTPLHCAFEKGNMALARALVFEFKADLGDLPVDVAVFDSKIVPAKSKYCTAIRVFVLGNSGAGKSFFIESLKKKESFTSPCTRESRETLS